MSSSICTHFTQNAWKKDLCSNCFKSKEEHKQSSSSAVGSRFAFSLRSNASTKQSETDHKKCDYPNKHKTPAKSIIKVRSTAKPTGKRKAHRVSFPKHLAEVIGYGGEWSDADDDDDDDDDDDHDFMNLANDRDEMAATSTDDEETIELKRITRANTDFNMNNGNLLGDPQENIKKSFAALKLGAPQVDKEGKKQTLKINVVPFGASASSSATACSVSTPSSSAPSSITSTTSSTTTTSMKTKFEKVENHKVTQATKTIVTSVKKVTTAKSEETSKSSSVYSVKSEVVSSDSSDGKNSPPIERAMEKSLLDEISETLEQQSESRKLDVTAATPATPTTASKIKFEISSLSETLENKPFLDLKKPIARNPPITKDTAKPKINVFHKYSDSDSNASDGENGVSAYYDVVETQVSYENLPDGKYANCKAKLSENHANGSASSSSTAEAAATPLGNQNDHSNKSMFSSSQYITDMLLSSKTRAASYNLHEGNFMTSKITSDGLIVTKCSSDDALDSTGSSFDGSSDEEASYNMTRSESDSGIGISIGSDYKNIIAEKEHDRERMRVEKKLSVSTNNSDYEDIQVSDQVPVMPKAKNTALLPKTTAFTLEKSRELHGEPDGSADPDGSLENKDSKMVTSTATASQLPALPKSPPPTKLIDARPSFLHGLQKQQHPPVALKKPELPAKPLVSPANTPMKSFFTKRPTTNMEQQVINQLQMVISKSTENLNGDACKEDPKLKKGRAPNPPPETKLSAPPTPERDYNVADEFAEKAKSMAKAMTAATDGKQLTAKPQTPETKSTEVIDTANSGPVRTEVDKSNTKSSAKAEATHHNNSTLPMTTTPTPKPKPSSSLSPNGETSSTGTNTVTSSSIYTRKLPTVTTNTSSTTSANNINGNNTNSSKNAASPVIREKDKRERATVNPKFRSLNTFVMQRTNAAKNLQLQAATSSLSLKPMTPEPLPKSYKNQFSLSEECLAAAAATKSADRPNAMSASTINLANQASDKHKTALPAPPAPKTKTKFSIKKFLRMGASKTTDNLHKKDAIYSEICTGDETNVSGKPRLVIIHPIDINPTAVEVVKDITKTNEALSHTETVAVITAKPPAPPLRATEGQRVHELNKPARPPPPKSAELRRKQKISLSPSASIGSETSGSLKCKADNVYANLGEIRSAIAPRKPERTASMREREAQLELARQRHGGGTGKDCTDTISICSSNGDNVLCADAAHSQKATTTTNPQQQQQQQLRSTNTTNAVDGKPPTGSVAPNRTSTFERTTASKSDAKMMPITNKMELFEIRSNATTSNTNTNTLGSTTSATSASSTNEGRPSSLKDSVRKINSTIDSYLKDKREYENMYEFVKGPSSPPPPPARSIDFGASAAGQRLVQPRRNNLYSDTASIASYTRSEYGPVRNFGLNNSLANIPRVISASYCGSEVGEFDIYSPYSYYGSEAGGDVATDINDSVWGIPSAIKNRTKATNRLRMRKGRSVVHKNIEDNYTAVVVANHEALAQVLDQLQQTPIIPAALRPLANAVNLRFEDFTIIDGAQAFVVGKKAFHAAVWTSAPVTLALSADCNQLAGVGGELSQMSGGVSGVLNPITEFCDLVPCYHLPLMPSTEVTLLQATISVLPRLQLETLQSIGAILKNKSHVLDKSNFNFRGSIPNLNVGSLKDNASMANGNALRNVMSVQNLSTLNEENEKSMKADGEQGANSAGVAGSAPGVNASGMPAFDDVMTREVAFIMLQLVNGMKNLQSKAIEEMPLSLSNVVLSKDVENKDAQARLCVLQGNHQEEDEAMGTLCRCAYLALNDMLPSTKITAILADILKQERAESLSKAKSVLEFILWGPSDVVLTGSTKERELALQRWLDLERATVLHGLVRTRVELTVYDECHLMFLVRSTAKMMNDAAKIVYTYQQQHSGTEQKD